jgi:hypothetical protein
MFHKLALVTGLNDPTTNILSGGEKTTIGAGEERVQG